MVGGFPGNAFVFIEFVDGGGVFELLVLAIEAFELDVAELVERFLELSCEAGAVQAEAREEAVGVDDVEGRGLGAGGWGLSSIEQVGF